MYCQLWAIGRGNHGEEPGVKVVGAGNVAFPDGLVPTEMSIADIKRYIQHYKHAAECAIKAGFDGVEVHGSI
jgi:2,4-dienoyl-CoA reductase-like NADH-dependent reductase (Old Yellow Enzyme family)